MEEDIIALNELIDEAASKYGYSSKDVSGIVIDMSRKAGAQIRLKLSNGTMSDWLKLKTAGE
jgi:hypothetical protein